VIFGVGGGMSIYEGILHLIHPSPQHQPFWNYVVLGIAALFEGTSWLIAMRHFLATKPPGLGVAATIRGSKDPNQFVVLLEDSAALIGIAIAFAGTALGAALHNPLYDGAASVLIGVVLCAVAVVLVYETRGLLIGEGVDPKRADAILNIVLDDVAVEVADRPLTMYLGPDEVLLNLALRFRRDLPVGEAEEAIRRIEHAIRERYPEVHRIFLEAAAVQTRRAESRPA
jgi:divalent metal cation (Fe/Co/Zn/Cd) transporter